MTDRFKSDDWDTLTASERVYRCYLMAEEARQLSKEATPELARVYQQLADQFSKLAVEIAASKTS